MRVIVGLGNPGRKYARTRHNAGFLLADALVARWHLLPERIAPNADAFGGVAGAERIVVLKPTTFMNRSGEALAFLSYTTVDPARDLLVMTDDFALPVGGFRLRPSGSSGGHNGLESIEAALGSRNYARFRVGVGPLPEGIGDWAEFVLAPWEPEELEILEGIMPTLADAVECWLAEGVERAMNRFNQLGKPGRDS